MIDTIRHGTSSFEVTIAKLLIGYLKPDTKIEDSESYIKAYSLFDEPFYEYVQRWQNRNNLTPDGIIGPATWKAIAGSLPTCSTSKNKKSGYTFALQVLLDTNITCDGIYGPRTKAAVSVFQDANGLSVDGICGKKTWNALIVGVNKDIAPLEPSEDSGKETEPVKAKFKQPVDYKQYDSKWANKIYSNHNSSSQTMRSSGCGPTSMGDVVATMKDKSVTPWTLAQLSMKWGDRSYDSGTLWSFFKPHCFEHYRFAKCVQSANWSALTACLDAGGYVVCSMGPGYWTSGGHFICAWKYDSTYVYCNDPASSKRTKQKISEFKKERKQFFCFYPDNTISIKNDISEELSESNAVSSGSVKRGSKICDISHHQPDVEYDAFIADTSLIILRPGYRGTGGSVKQDTKFEQHASALKQRGVDFGTYFYSIADTEDKAREEARMYYKWAKDYNPLFWTMDAELDQITTKSIVAFQDELRKLGAKKVGCYVANQLYTKYKFDTIRDKFDFIWIPRYGSTKPDHPCDIWQYTSTGSVNGICGNVDLDRVTGEGKTLEWFLEKSN